MAKSDEDKSWERLWTPLLTALFAGMGGLGIWYLNSNAQRAQQDYERREQRYATLVSSIPGFYQGGSIEQQTAFLKELDLCWLYCPDNVIQAGKAFLATVETGADANEATQRKALGSFVLAIRQDLLSREAVTGTRLAAEDFRFLLAAPRPVVETPRPGPEAPRR